MGEALELLDQAYEYNERRIRNLMSQAKDLMNQLTNATEEMAELNKKQIEINDAKKTLRKETKDK